MLFISHSSSDAKIVEALVNFFEKSFKGENKPDIRCTSVEGYKLSLGDTPKTKLPSEINSSLVICLLTPRSLQSPWVLFELGAAWGLSSRVVPLLHEVKHDQLPAALSGDIAGYLSSRADILSVIDQINTVTGWEKEAASRIDNALNVFMKVVNEADSTPPERLLQRRQLQQELPFDEIYRRVQKEIFVWGWSGVNANNHKTRNMISQLASGGKKVNFLVLNPSKAKAASKHLALGPVCSWTEDGVGNDISAGKRFLVELRESLPNAARFNFECRETSWLMTWSGIAIDPKDSHGLLQIESYLYCFADHVGTSNHLEYRPNLLITRESSHYDPFWYSLDRMWSEANPFTTNGV